LEFNQTVNLISLIFKNAQIGTINDWDKELVKTEPAISEDLMGRLRGEFDHFFKKNPNLLGRVELNLYSRGGGGNNTTEANYGIDFLVILTLTSPEGEPITKGIFMQAKNDGNGVTIWKSSSRYKGTIQPLENQFKNQIDR
jgi:hypothetical protein